MTKLFKSALIVLLATLIVLSTAVLVACNDDKANTVKASVDFGLPNVANTSFEVEKGATFADKLQQLLPTDTDFTFSGWFLSDGSQVTNSTVAPKSDFTVKAKWQVSYRVEYWLQSGDGQFQLSNDLTVDLIGEVGSTVTAEIKQLNSYVFDENNVDNVQQATLNSSGIVLKIYYLRAEVTVTFDKLIASATGEMTSLKASFGSVVTLPKNTFTSSFKFVGWCTTPDGKGTFYGDGAQISLSQSITLYAQWQTTYVVEVYEEEFQQDKYVYVLKNSVSGNSVIGNTVSAPLKEVTYDASKFVIDEDTSVLSGVLTEDGLTLTVNLALKTFAIRYMDDNTVDYVKYGASYTVRTPQDIDSNSKVISYSTSPTGDGRNYEFGAVIENVTSDIMLYPVRTGIYLDTAGSGDRVEINQGKTGLGAAVLIRGNSRFEGYLGENETNGYPEFEIPLSANLSLYGILFDDDYTFQYRNDEEMGFYVMYDMIDDEFYDIYLLLDGYGFGGLMLPADDGTERYVTYYVEYADSGYGDYLMVYYLPSNPDDYSYEFFIVVKLTGISDQLDGYFILCGEEGYIQYYYLYDNGEVNDELILYLDGYGYALVLEYDSSVDDYVVVYIGEYYPSENYTYSDPEFIFYDEEVSFGFYFIWFAQEIKGEDVGFFMIKHDEAGEYSSDTGANYPALYLDGYDIAAYFADENDEGRFGWYTVDRSGSSPVVTIEFADDIGGTMIVILNTENMTFSVSEDGFVIVDGVLLAYTGSSSIIVIPEGVVEIADGVFKDINITSVTFPSTLQKIGDYAFQNSGSSGGSALKVAIFLSEQPPVLGEDVFRWLKGDFRIFVPSGCEEAYRNAESWVKSTPSQPDGYAQFVTSEAEQADKPEFEIVDGVLVHYNNRDTDPSNVSITIPAEAMQIANGVFANLQYIVYVDLNNVTVIGSNAFYGCTGLTSIKFNPNTISIGARAFYECTGLASVDLGNVQFIESEAFSRCFNLSQVHIGNAIQSIGQMAFYMCSVEVDEEEVDIVPHDLVVTIESEVAPEMANYVFQGSQPRVYVKSYEVGIKYAQTPSWKRYVTCLRVDAKGSQQTWYSKANAGALLVLDDRAMFDEYYMGLYKWDGETLYVAWLNYADITDTLQVVVHVATVFNGELTGISFEDIYGRNEPYVFVQAGTTLTYTKDSETFEFTFGTDKGKFNGNDVTVEIVNYRMQFNFDGYTYKLELANDLTFTYTRTKITVVNNYTAEDGSTIEVRDGSSIYIYGTLADVDGRPLTTTIGWYAFKLSDNVYWFTQAWLSTTYRIVVFIDETNNTFTYEWSVNSQYVSCYNAEGDLAIVTVSNDGTVTSIHIIFVTSNGKEEVATQFTLIGEHTFTVVIDATVIVENEDGSTYEQASEFNGTYTLTLDLQNKTFTLEKNS